MTGFACEAEVRGHDGGRGLSAIGGLRSCDLAALASLMDGSGGAGKLEPGALLVWLSLGSNLPYVAGEARLAEVQAADRMAPVRVLIGALHALDAPDGDCMVLGVSSLWRTRPVGEPTYEQPDFFNAVAVLRTSLTIEQVLARTQAIEQRFGRVRDPLLPKGPRTLDLDLLLAVEGPQAEAHAGGVLAAAAPVLRDTVALRLPHPSMHLRRFVLAPMVELTPNLRHPGLHRTMGELLQALDPSDPENREDCVQRLDLPEWPALPA